MLKAISDSVIKRWENDYSPDYMRQREIKDTFKELFGKCA